MAFLQLHGPWIGVPSSTFLADRQRHGPLALVANNRRLGGSGVAYSLRSSIGLTGYTQPRWHRKKGHFGALNGVAGVVRVGIWEYSTVQ